jgi:hypothetical protein
MDVHSLQSIEFSPCVLPSSLFQVEPQALCHNKHEKFNLPLLRKLGTLTPDGVGILGLTVPEDYGGIHMDATAVALVYKELSYGIRPFVYRIWLIRMHSCWSSLEVWTCIRYNQLNFSFLLFQNSLLLVNNLAVNGTLVPDKPLAACV